MPNHLKLLVDAVLFLGQAGLLAEVALDGASRRPKGRTVRYWTMISTPSS